MRKWLNPQEVSWGFSLIKKVSAVSYSPTP